MLRFFKFSIGSFGAVVLAYLVAALIGSLWPVNSRWQPANVGVTIYLHDNGIHTSLILPRADPGFDPGILFVDQFAVKARADEQALTMGDGFPGPANHYPFLAVGWGDRDFFLETASWADVRPSTLLIAAFGSGATLIHVDQLTGLPPGDIRKIILRQEEYASLLMFVGRQLGTGHDGKVVARRGYGPDDRFYNTQGRYAYSGLYTCNNWIAAGLAKSGVRVGRWPPFSAGLMWWF